MKISQTAGNRCLSSLKMFGFFHVSGFWAILLSFCLRATLHWCTSNACKWIRTPGDLLNSFFAIMSRNYWDILSIFVFFTRHVSKSSKNPCLAIERIYRNSLAKNLSSEAKSHEMLFLYVLLERNDFSIMKLTLPVPKRCSTTKYAKACSRCGRI